MMKAFVIVSVMLCCTVILAGYAASMGCNEADGASGDLQGETRMITYRNLLSLEFPSSWKFSEGGDARLRGSSPSQAVEIELCRLEEEEIGEDEFVKLTRKMFSATLDDGFDISSPEQFKHNGMEFSSISVYGAMTLEKETVQVMATLQLFSPDGCNLYLLLFRATERVAAEDIECAIHVLNSLRGPSKRVVTLNKAD